MSTPAAPPRQRQLTNTAPWRLRTAIAAVVAVMVVVGMLTSRLPGREAAMLIPLVLLAAYLLPTLARTRHGLAVEGDRLYLRRIMRWHVIAGREVTDVQQVFNPGSPNFRVRTSAVPRGLVAATADLERGHSTLFGWLLAQAPQARLDAGAERTVALLQQRGLLDDAMPGSNPPSSNADRASDEP